MNTSPRCPVLMLFVVVLTGFSLPRGTCAAEQGDSKPPEVSQRVRDFIKPVPVEGDELRQKLAERHNVAVALLEAREQEYKQGVRDLGFVLEATRLVVEAKLDLADTEEARMAVLEETLEVAKLLEDHTRTLMENGVGSKADYQRARLGRLTVEVQILKAKQPPKP